MDEIILTPEEEAEAERIEEIGCIPRNADGI